MVRSRASSCSPGPGHVGGELAQPGTLAVLPLPGRDRLAQVVQLHATVVVAGPVVAHRPAQLGVPRQWGEVVEHHGHADVGWTGALLAVWISRSATVPRGRSTGRRCGYVDGLVEGDRAGARHGHSLGRPGMLVVAAPCRAGAPRRSTVSGCARGARAGTHRAGGGRHPHGAARGSFLDDPAGCLGFAIHRTDHTEGEARWLRGMKTFESVVPDPPPGSDWPDERAPGAGFPVGRLRRPARRTSRRTPCRPRRGGHGAVVYEHRCR